MLENEKNTYKIQKTNGDHWEQYMPVSGAGNAPLAVDET